jgi:hypothetical protein
VGLEHEVTKYVTPHLVTHSRKSPKKFLLQPWLRELTIIRKFYVSRSMEGYIIEPWKAISLSNTWDEKDHVKMWTTAAKEDRHVERSISKAVKGIVQSS